MNQDVTNTSFARICPRACFHSEIDKIDCFHPRTGVANGDIVLRSDAAVGVENPLEAFSRLAVLGGVVARGVADKGGDTLPLNGGGEVVTGEDKNSSTLDAESERLMSCGISSSASLPV